MEFTLNLETLARDYCSNEDSPTEGSFVHHGPEHFKMSIRYIINLMKCKLHFCPQANAITRYKVTAISITINFSSEIFESVERASVCCCDILSLRAAGIFWLTNSPGNLILAQLCRQWKSINMTWGRSSEETARYFIPQCGEIFLGKNF